MTEELKQRLPKPARTYADHSYPAYTEKQMLEYGEALIRECAEVAWENFLTDHSVVPTVNRQEILAKFGLTKY